MDIRKPVELIGRGGDRLCLGTTDNLSDQGIGARFDTLPALDADVLLRIFWDADQQPVEQPARVIWTAGEAGAARVGLRVGELQRGENTPAPSAAEVAPTPAGAVNETPLFLELGCPVVMNTAGVAIETVVADVGPIRSDNTVQVVLRITDDAFADPGARAPGEAPSSETEDWTPHPVRDAWRAVVKYAGPVALLLFRGFRAFLSLAGRLSRPLWQRLPEPVRTRGQSAVRFLTKYLGPVIARATARYRQPSKK